MGAVEAGAAVVAAVATAVAALAAWRAALSSDRAAKATAEQAKVMQRQFEADRFDRRSAQARQVEPTGIEFMAGGVRVLARNGSGEALTGDRGVVLTTAAQMVRGPDGSLTKGVSLAFVVSLPEGTEVERHGIEFTDANGVSWRRWARSEPEEIPPLAEP